MVGAVGFGGMLGDMVKTEKIKVRTKGDRIGLLCQEQ